MLVKISLNIITGFLTLMWVYSAFSKVVDLEKFKVAMRIQVFPTWFGRILVYALPIWELALAVLLLTKSYNLFGLYATLFTMLLFTLYIGGAVFKLYERTPCACGGLFAKLGWRKHFILNIYLTIIALGGVFLAEYL